MTRRDDEASWDDLTPPTQEELQEARALRDALEGEGEHPDAELCRALRLADDPPELDPRVNEWLVKRAIHRAAPTKRGKAVVVLFGAGTALALAAGVALVLSGDILEPGGNVMPRASIAQASLIPSRSTQSLFDEPFQRHGGTSERIDRIARARGRDFRTNLYERMGVRQ